MLWTFDVKLSEMRWTLEKDQSIRSYDKAKANHTLTFGAIHVVPSMAVQQIKQDTLMSSKHFARACVRLA